ARVRFIKNEYVLNPQLDEMPESQLDLVVAGTKDAVLMVESEAKQLSEEVMLGAVLFGHEQMQAAINSINELVAEAGKAKWDWQPSAAAQELTSAISGYEGAVTEAYAIADKQ